MISERDVSSLSEVHDEIENPSAFRSFSHQITDEINTGLGALCIDGFEELFECCKAAMDVANDPGL